MQLMSKITNGLEGSSDDIDATSCIILLDAIVLSFAEATTQNKKKRPRGPIMKNILVSQYIFYEALRELLAYLAAL